MFDCALDLIHDPNPNEGKAIRAALGGSDVIVKVRLHYDNLHLLQDLLYPDVKLIVQLGIDGSVREKNSLWYKAKEQIVRMRSENLIRKP